MFALKHRRRPIHCSIRGLAPQCPLACLAPPSLSLTRQEDYEAYYVEQDARNAATATITSVDFTKLHTLVSKLKQLDQERTELTERIARCFEGLEVLVVGAQATYGRTVDGYKASVFKGKRGTVIADFDSKERAERLKRQELKRRKNIQGTRGGSLRRTRLPLAQARFLPNWLLRRTPQMASVARKWLVPRPPTRPGTPVPQLQPGASGEAFGGVVGIIAHTLAGEDTGAWLCVTALVRKHVDVMIKGVRAWGGTKDMKNSNKLRKVEGKHSVVLLSEQFPEGELKRTKFRVYRVGGDGGLPQQRVLVLGGDVDNDKSQIGQYAETQPHIQHSHGDGVVTVRFEQGNVRFYHELSLCRSTNKAIDSPDHSFPASSFN
ncbi:hypothetical protein B0H17DRAFT_1215483 [Mycena rosella]|uniref:Uncharacterized protein n=1 Tax=Mycena rosella TaxID=1033263 RepID=A0AAD7CHC4_MYCRO|nr:hypothetical protein B0H17DRAFT_1215483 [Mycena rosella]